MEPFQEKQTGICRPPTKFETTRNLIFRLCSLSFAALVVLLIVYIVVLFSYRASDQIQEEGVSFLFQTKWDNNTKEYGIFPEIWGTLFSSILALVIGVTFGVAVAIFLSEGFLASVIFKVLAIFKVQFHSIWGNLPLQAEGLVKNLIRLLAAIPSVVYGLWGIYVVIPAIRPGCDWLHDNMGWIPLFRTPLRGPGLLPAALVLAIMILPTIAAISRDSLAAVPYKIREAAYGLGATRWEAILGVFLPTAAPGIYGSIILAFGRALGETMALAMLAGGQNNVTWSLFAPVNTLAALLANNFPEAINDVDKGRLMYAALVLMAITLIVNMLGTYVLQRSQARFMGARG